jgi:hypothetical protein
MQLQEYLTAKTDFKNNPVEGIHSTSSTTTAGVSAAKKTNRKVSLQEISFEFSFALYCFLAATASNYRREYLSPNEATHQEIEDRSQ